MTKHFAALSHLYRFYRRRIIVGKANLKVDALFFFLAKATATVLAKQ